MTQIFQHPIVHAAHAYAERGWPVLPLGPRAKQPLGRLVPHGLYDATVDHELIDRWWREEPYANVGLRTDVVFDALDSDTEEAAAPFVDLGPGVPPMLGPTVATARGWHGYFAPSGLGNGKLAPDLDHKGRNGYVVAPPSVHPSGFVYRWYAGDGDPYWGVDARIEPAPGWLLPLLYPPANSRRTYAAGASRGLFGPRRGRRYAQQALQNEIARGTWIAHSDQGIRADRAIVHH